MRSYLPCLPSCVSAVKACLLVAIAVNFVLDVGSDVRVCLEGIRLVDPSVCFLRDPKARRAQVGA